jgi:pyridoxine 5-phosphate synthase
VNVNKIATLRNARGGDVPNVVQVATDCERFGADGITVHPRPDERHITTKDVYDLKEVVRTEFNIEGYPDVRFIKLIEEIRPKQVTLVPDPPGVLTSNAGWDTKANLGMLSELAAHFRSIGIRSSVFVDTKEESIAFAAESGMDRIELYTGPFAENYHLNTEEAVIPYIRASELAHSLGLGVNAGHDLNLDNLRFFKEQLPHLDEVSIGHALISDALYLGLENTIQRYKYLLG